MRPLLGAGLAAVLEVVEVLREHPAARPRLGGGQRPAPQGDVPRPRRDRDGDGPARADRLLHRRSSGSPRSPRKGDTKATVVSHDGLRFDLRVVPPESFGNLLQHFTGSKDHNVALREDAVRRGLSISEYGVKNIETGEVFTTARRGRALRVPRLPVHPARAAREPRRARRRAQGRAAGARRRLATCAATCTVTRRGRRTARTRSRRWRAAASSAATSTWRSPTTRTTCATGGSRRSGARSTG